VVHHAIGRILDRMGPPDFSKDGHSLIPSDFIDNSIERCCRPVGNGQSCAGAKLVSAVPRTLHDGRNRVDKSMRGAGVPLSMPKRQRTHRCLICNEKCASSEGWHGQWVRVPPG
jgi:hypothetical protein